MNIKEQICSNSNKNCLCNVEVYLFFFFIYDYSIYDIRFSYKTLIYKNIDFDIYKNEINFKAYNVY